MVISSVGKISFKELIKLIEKYFGIAGMKTGINGRNRFKNYIPKNKIVEKNTFQSHCILGNIAYDVMHPKRITMVLLNNILGGQAMNSRLNLTLREKKGIAYNIESGYTPYIDTGLFNVYFGTDHDNLEKATDLVLKEFKLIREKKLGIMQLSKAQKQLMGQIAISTENHEDLMLSIGKSFLLFNKVEAVESVFKKIETITRDDIQEIANQILAPENISRIVYR